MNQGAERVVAAGVTQGGVGLEVEPCRGRLLPDPPSLYLFNAVQYCVALCIAV